MNYKIAGKYWNIIDKIIEDYKKTVYYEEADKMELIAVNWLTNRLDRSAPINSCMTTDFTITENEFYTLIKSLFILTCLYL